MLKLIGRAVFSSLLFLTAVPVWAGQTTITWHGHAAFEVVTPKGKVLMIDPWLKNPANPRAKDGADPLAEIVKVHYILISHGHFDHIGDAVELANKTRARLVTNYELGTNMVKILGFPKKQVGFDTLMNTGGEITIGGGEVTVSLTHAVHSSGMKNPNATQNQPDIVYGGNPTGILLKIKGGPTIYHTGDTAYFKDMQLIGENYQPDIALINIGGHFGMEPLMAAKAAQAVQAKIAVPHHFATFPILTMSAEEFGNKVKENGIEFLEMKPGETIVFEGADLVK
jgi:L-ascorbate metabolism protein UlaG (beta-lactamase superfamily)